MSQENVEVVLRSIAAWNAGGAQEAKQYWAEDYEFHDSPTMPDPKVVCGREAVAKHLTDLATVVGDLRLIVKDARACPDGQVLVLAEMELHGTESGVLQLGQLAQVTELVDGEQQRTRAFLSWPEALEAVGLSEQDISSVAPTEQRNKNAEKRYRANES